MAVTVLEKNEGPETVMVEADGWSEEGSWVKFYQGPRFVQAFAIRLVLRITAVIDAEVLA